LYKQTKTASQRISLPKKATLHNSHGRENQRIAKELENGGQAEKGVNLVASTLVGGLPTNQHDQVLKLATAIRSRSALLQFCSMVKASRLQQDNRTFEDVNDYEERFVQCIANLNSSEMGSDLQKLRVRLDQIRLVDSLENSRTGQLRCSSEVKRKVLKRFNWTESTLKEHQKKGNMWKKICDPFPGLLCFIFPQRGNVDKIKQKDYLDLASNSTQLEEFHMLLQNNYVRSLCVAGKAFQDSLMGGSLEQLKWEVENVDIWTLAEEEVLHYITPCHKTS
jgi:hypothetical protein